MSEKSHCPNISPKCGRNRRPVVPKLRVPTQRHPSWGILEKSRIGFSFTDHHCLNPSPPPTNVPFTSPVTHSPTFLPLLAPHLVRSNTCRLGLQPPRCRRPPTELGPARRTPRPTERRGRERSKERAQEGKGGAQVTAAGDVLARICRRRGSDLLT